MLACADALFTDWPEVEAIVGNPLLWGRKIRKEQGVKYLNRLQEVFSSVDSRSDFAVIGFSSHTKDFEPGAALVLLELRAFESERRVRRPSTISLRTAERLSTPWPSRVWPGEASINVSMVNWHHGPLPGPHTLIVGDEELQLESIPNHLQLYADLGSACLLNANTGGYSMGPTFGHSASADPMKSLRRSPQVLAFVHSRPQTIYFEASPTVYALAR